MLNIPSGAAIIFVSILIYGLLKAIKVLRNKFINNEVMAA